MNLSANSAFQSHSNNSNNSITILLANTKQISSKYKQYNKYQSLVGKYIKLSTRHLATIAAIILGDL